MDSCASWALAAADDAVESRQVVGERLEPGRWQPARLRPSAWMKMLHYIASAVLTSFRMSSPSWKFLVRSQVLSRNQANRHRSARPG